MEQAQDVGAQPVAVERTDYQDRGVLVAPSPQDIEIMERRVEYILARLAVRNISGVDTLQEVQVRDLIPEEDLNAGADTGWTNENEWDQTTLTANSVQETYALQHQNRAEDKVIAFFAISNVAVSPATTQVRFNDAQGGVFEILQTQGLLTDEEVIGLLNDPIISATSQQDMTIEQYVTATSDKLVFHGKVAEEAGTTMGDNPSLYLSRQAGNIGGGR